MGILYQPTHKKKFTQDGFFLTLNKKISPKPASIHIQDKADDEGKNYNTPPIPSHEEARPLARYSVGDGASPCLPYPPCPCYSENDNGKAP